LSFYRAEKAVHVLKGRLAKKNPQIQCNALDLLVVMLKNCPGPFHKATSTEEFLQIFPKLLSIPGIPPKVFFYWKFVG
jgi:hypothetical protein